MRLAKISLITLSFLYFNPLGAATDEGVLNLMRFLDESSPTEIMCDEGDQANRPNHPLAEKCAVDLCGRPQDLKPSKPTLLTIDDYLDRLDISDRLAPLMPELEKSWGKIEELHAKRLAALKELSHPEHVRRYLDKLPTKEFNRLFSSHVLSERRTQFQKAPHWPTPYDDFDYQEVPLELRDQLKKMRHKLLSRDATSPRALSYSTNKKFVGEQLKKMEESLSRDIEQFRKDFPDEDLENPMEDPGYKKSSENSRIGDLSFVYEKINYLNIKKMCDEECLKLTTELITKKSGELLKVYNDTAKNMKLYKDDFILGCKTYAALSNHSNNRFDEFKTKIPQYLQEVQKKMSPYMSEKSLGKLATLLNDINFKNEGLRPPPEVLIKNNIEKIQWLKDPDISGELANDYRFFKRSPSQFPNPAKVYDLCSDYKKHTVWDNARVSEEKPTVDLSHYTCLNHQLDPRADSTIFHEISHIVDLHGRHYNTYSSHTNKILDQQRKCVSSQKKALSLDNKGLNKNSTEDYADFLSAVVSIDFINSHTAIRCEMLSTDINQTKYTDLSFKQDARYEHSNDLYRILHTRIAQKKPLPASCLELLEKFSDDYDFKDCSL